MPATSFLSDHYRKRARIRTRILALACALWFLYIVGHLVFLQVFDHARSQAQVIEQNQNTTDIQPRRGTIFDRQGRILATSLPARSVYYLPNPADPMAARIEPIRRLTSILDLSVKDLERIEAAIRGNARRVWLKRKADPAAAARAKSYKLRIAYDEDSKRFYPLGPLAAQVLGGVDIDEKGLSGIELKFNSVLQGRKGQALILRDARKREYRYEVLTEPENGRDIVLTLDQTIQFYAQTAIQKAVTATGSVWGTAIVSDPGTGEILAMATAPGFDPNSYPARPEADNNRAVRHMYEPGSIFKIVTAAAALENRVVTLADTFDCSKGSIDLAGGPIRDHKQMGILSFAEVIAESSNVGTILLGRRLSELQFYSMIAAFGFGRRTGIELPAEAAGKLPPMDKWSGRSQASLSIGYEILATPIQMLQALNIVAAGGQLFPPHIVKLVAGGKPRSSEKAPAIVLSPEACGRLAAVLERAVAEGTGKAARPDGYETAGKTGTTQKYDPVLKAYSGKRHTASFAGFVPAGNPRLSIIVVLDDPKSEEQYGGQLAAPVFREIAQRSLRTIGVRPGPLDHVLQAARRAEREKP